MSERDAPDAGPGASRHQLSLRLGRGDYELLQRMAGATGLPASQVMRALIRQGAERLVLETRARHKEEENWRRILQREEARWVRPLRG
jgi:uncharacterized protein (DUF1778 family)